MDYNFDAWQKLLENYQRDIAKDLQEIRDYKEQVRQIKEDLEGAVASGYYLRDNKRIVISAPEVIIGDVDKDGLLRSASGSVVVLRAQNVNLEGVGEGGQVSSRASSIRQTAVDPGVDGMESVVYPSSTIVSQASQISLEANQTAGVFSQIPHGAGVGGVSIHADGNLILEASASAESQKSNVQSQLDALNKEKSDAEAQVKAGIQSHKDLGKALEQLYKGTEDILSDPMSIRTELSDLAQAQNQFKVYSRDFYSTFVSCAQSLSRLAEINRKIACLKAEKDAIKTGDDYKKKATGASLSIIGERVDIVSRDGDGNLRDNEGAGVGILANQVQIEALDAKGTLQKEGKVLIHAMGVELSTADAKDVKYDDKGKMSAGEFPASGDVLVRSKTVSVETLDMECKDGELKEKALTKESSVSLRTEKVDVSVTDTEGKATGSIALNAKDISLRSMNVEKEKRTDDKLAEGSTMLLLSEKMFVGAKKKDIKSKKVQVVTEEAGMFADKTLELQQGDAKGVLQLEGGNAALGGSKTQVYGETTLNGKTEVKDELKAPKATIDHVEAKSSFKSSNISDGIPVPPPPSTAKLSAKLKAEDAPEKK